MIIDQKNVVIGFVVAIFLLIILGYLIPNIGGLLALIIAGIITGYLVNNSIKIGMINGALVGVLSGLGTIALLFFKFGASSKVAGALIILSLGIISSYIILGAVGGMAGSLIKQRMK